MNISPTQDIVDDLQAGKMVILTDAEDRENEGDLLMAAQFVTPEAINFMAKYARGLVCLTLTTERCQQLGLPLMVADNGASFGTNFTVSIEAAEGVTTGISAADRAKTVQAAVNPQAKIGDLVQPGHIFPVRSVEGGVLARAGHTEAGCDLTRMAGLTPAAVICEVMNDDGSMARMPELMVFAEQHGLKIGTIADLIHYRSQHETLIEQMGERPIDTPWGSFRMVVFRDKLTHATHLALVAGQPGPEQETLVRVHEPFSALDLLDPLSHSHTWTVPHALETIAGHEHGGVVILLHSDETGEVLLQRALPPEGVRATPKWDSKTFGIGAQMLRALGVGKMRLLASAASMPSMTGFGLEVCGFAQPEHLTIPIGRRHQQKS